MQAFKLIAVAVLVGALTACVDQQNLVDNRVQNDSGSETNTAIPVHPEGNTGHTDNIKPEALEDVVVPEREQSPRSIGAIAAGRSKQAASLYATPQIAMQAPLGNYYVPQESVDRENYKHFDENPVKLVSEEPLSTFSIDVDTAAYSNIRRILNKEGRLPSSDAVKLEEMINYFNYSYPSPESLDTPFSVTTEIAPAPWNNQHQLLQIGLKGYEPPQKQRPDANLVFLVDVSGSMRSPDKLGLVKKSLRLLVNQMRNTDRIALVVYAGSAGLVLDSTAAEHKAKILAAIDSLESGGSTNGGAGIRLAYNVAQQHFIKQGINRIVIASDADMNVGTTNINALKNLIERKRKGGVSLTTLGFGSGNYNYALMEQLADVGNGNAAYIDGLREAQKVLVEELQSTFLTIAKDVKIQIEFNPTIVAEYRLIGYEDRLLNREDFRNDKVDAGEIGAGHTVTALYELTLTNSGADMIEPRRYQNTEQKRPPRDHNSKSNEVAFVKLRYKKPQTRNSIEISTPVLRSQIKPNMTAASRSLRFASAVAGFGQLLKGGKYTQDWNYDDVLRLIRSAKGNDEHGYRGELISLVELAKGLSLQES